MDDGISSEKKNTSQVFLIDLSKDELPLNGPWAKFKKEMYQSTILGKLTPIREFAGYLDPP